MKTFDGSSPNILLSKMKKRRWGVHVTHLAKVLTIRIFAKISAEQRILWFADTYSLPRQVSGASFN